MDLVLLIILLVLLTGTIPRWNDSRNWGYGPSGLLTVILVAVLVLIFPEHIPRRF